MAIVNLGYLANAWVYLMDKYVHFTLFFFTALGSKWYAILTTRQSRSTSCEYRALVPLSFGMWLFASWTR